MSEPLDSWSRVKNCLEGWKEQDAYNQFVPFEAMHVSSSCWTSICKPVLGGYHNFMIPAGLGFHKVIYKRVQFSPKKICKIFTLGKGINIKKK